MSNNRILGNLASYIDSSSNGGAITKSGNNFFIQAMTDSDVGGTPATGGFAGTDSASVKGLITTARVVQKSGRSKNAPGLKNVLQGEIAKLNPSASATYNLGDSSNPIDEIILDSSATIFFGDISLTSILKSGTSTIAVAVVVTPDPVSGSAETSFLLKTDSTQTDAQVDASTNSATITENGNVKSTAFSPYHPKGYSSYFDGTGDYITVPSNSGAPFDFGTDNFTIEGWFYLTTSGSWTSYWGISEGGGSSQKINLYDASGDGTLDVDVNGSVVFSSSAVLTDLQRKWAHIALVREGTGTNQTKLYVNGSVVGQGTVSTNFSGFSQPFTVGHNGELYSGAFNGYISDFRVVNGTAVYTADFTPPTERLTAITGTELLTCNLPYIADGSSNALTVTVNGDAKTIQFSQFDHVAYSTSSHGGSVYFDGSGDYLTTPSNTGFDLGTGDFTIEAWIYPTALSSNRLIVDTYVSGDNGSYQLYWRGTGSSLAFYSTGDGVFLQDPSSSNIVVNTWNHVAVSRSGTSAKLFVNGTVVDTATNSRDFTHGNTLGIGAQVTTLTNYFHGYISDVRIVKGTAVYTADFTPPTEPLTAIAGTQLLTCTNKNSVYDAAGGDTITLNGNATASNTQTKYSDSVVVDGSADGVWVAATGPLDQNVILNTDFTVEFWAYPTAWYDDNTFFSIGRNNNYCPFVMWTGGNDTNVRFYANNTGSTWNLVNNGDSGIVKWTNSWKHIAMTYDTSATTVKFWVDGTLVSTHTGVDGWENANAASYWTFATDEYSAAGMAGYLEDIRITKGVARYTANFTPPTAALEG